MVVTGMGGVTALGDELAGIRARLAAGETAVRRMPEWDRFPSLNTRLAAPVDGFDVSRPATRASSSERWGRSRAWPSMPPNGRSSTPASAEIPV